MLHTRLDLARRQLKIIGEIQEERKVQDAKWGGYSHDDDHDRDLWVKLLRKHQTRALKAMNKGDLDEYRKHMVRVAALAVAALESHDRRSGE